MKNNICSLLILILIVVFNYTYVNAQDYVYRFAQVGTSGTPSIIKNDSVGFIYVGGSFYGSEFTYGGKTITGISGVDQSSIFVLKTNSNGKLVWIHPIIAAFDSLAFPNLTLKNIKNNNAGELIVSFTAIGASEIIFGRHNLKLNNTAYESHFFAKISKEGYVLWVKQIRFSSEFSSDAISNLVVSEKGDVFISGEFSGSGIFIDKYEIVNPNEGNCTFVAKLSDKGAVVWGKAVEAYGSSSLKTNIDIHPMVLTVANDGRVFVCGYFSGNGTITINGVTSTGNSTTNSFLICYNETGDEKWGKVLIGDGEDYLTNILVDNLGQVSLLGYSTSKTLPVDNETFITTGEADAFIARLNFDGDLKWLTPINVQNPNGGLSGDKTLFGLDRATNVYLADEFYSNQLLGVQNNHGVGTSDIFAAKFNAVNGKVDWTFSAGSSDNNDLSYGDIDERGNISIGGYYSTNFNFGTTSLNVGSGNNYFYSNIHNTGHVLFAKRIGGTSKGNIFVNDITRDFFGNVSIVGEFYGTALNLGDKPLSNADDDGIYIARYCRVATIKGVVKDVNGDAVTTGKVKVFGFSFRQRSPISDSTLILADGSFIIPDIPLGRYIIKVEPDNSGDKKHLPGYFPSVGSWEDANEILITTLNNLTGIRVILPLAQQLDGTNRLQGQVTEIDTNDVFKSTMKKPMSGGRASLARSKDKATDYEIIATVETDEYGYFEFSYVPNGSYTLLVDVPGLPSVDPHSVSVSNGMFVSNLNYYITESEVQGVGSPDYSISEEIVSVKEIVIFPNPVHQFLNIKIEENMDVKFVRIKNLQGKVVITTNKFYEQIDVSQLVPGIYIVETISNEKALFAKFIKR